MGTESAKEPIEALRVHHVMRHASVSDALWKRRSSRRSSLINAPVTTNVKQTWRISCRDRAAYIMDMWISRRSTQIVVLIIVMAVQVSVGGSLFSLVDESVEDKTNISEGVWKAWTFSVDPASQAEVEKWAPRAIACLITVLGILFFSTIVGFVVDKIQEKMNNLKKGKSSVVEQGHVLMLGWNDKSVAILKELANANASAGGVTIVVLSDLDKELLESEISNQVTATDLRRSRVVCRSGSGIHTSDLVKVSAATARCVIVLAEGTDADASDAMVLRVVLSLKSLKHRLDGYIVAEIRDVDNEPLVRLVGGKDVETIVSHDILGRLMVMCARQPGLAKVYASILGFTDDEFYEKDWPYLVGLKFGELCERFPAAICCGVRLAKDGSILLRPPLNYVMEVGDKLLVIAEDDDTYKPLPPADVDFGTLPPKVVEAKDPEMILCCGWRRDLRDVLMLLDAMLPSGSQLHLFCEVPLEERGSRLAEGGFDANLLENMTIIHHCGNAAVRRQLERLPLDEFSSAMILADQAREKDMMHSDSHSLATMLLLRNIQGIMREGKIIDSIGEGDESRATSKVAVARPAWGSSKGANEVCPLVCEILDSRTQRTIATNKTVSKQSEFVQSNELISRILAMVSEDRGVKNVLDELLGPDGTSFQVRNPSQLVHAGERATFWTVAKRAQAFNNSILVGYLRHDGEGGVIINPKNKAEEISWDDKDIVLLVGMTATSHKLAPAISQAAGSLVVTHETKPGDTGPSNCLLSTSKEEALAKLHLALKSSTVEHRLALQKYIKEMIRNASTLK